MTTDMTFTWDERARVFTWVCDRCLVNEEYDCEDPQRVWHVATVRIVEHSKQHRRPRWYWLLDRIFDAGEWIRNRRTR